MNRKAQWGAILAGIALVAPANAKKPPAADEEAVRSIIERVYAPYSQPVPELPEDGTAPAENSAGSAMDGFEPPYTRSLDALVTQWGALMQKSEELYRLNSFDWFCQCQDNDSNSAKLIRQSYTQSGSDRITASILFSAGDFEGKPTGAPLIYRFKREDGVWKVDDMKFHDFTSLRKRLAADIRDATRDMAAQP